MAWALDSAPTPVAAATGTTATVSHTLGSGSNRIVIACAFIATLRNVSGVTYNGVAMTAVTNQATGTDEARLFYMLESQLPAAGTYDCVATADGTLGVGILGLSVASFTGVAQQAEEASVGQSYGNVSSISDALSPTTALALVIAGLSVDDPRTITETGGQGAAIATLDGTGGLQRIRLYAWTGPDPAALVTSSFTLSAASSGNAQNVAAFKVAVGAVPGGHYATHYYPHLVLDL